MVDEAFNFCLARKKSKTRVPLVVRDETFPRPFIVTESDQNARAAIIAACIEGKSYAQVHSELKDRWHLREARTIVGRYVSYYCEAVSFYWLWKDFEQFYAPIADRRLDALKQDKEYVIDYPSRFAELGIYTIGDFLRGSVTRGVGVVRKSVLKGGRSEEYYEWIELVRQELYTLADSEAKA
jgi:hypothetical protein